MSYLLKCTACSLSSENNLYTIQCFHSLCKDCLEVSIKYHSQTSRKQSSVSYIQCPTCDYHTCLEFSKCLQPEDLCKMPYVLKTLIELQYGLSSPECVVCKTRGSTTKSKFWCFQCAEHFCPECISFHSALPNFDKHKPIVQKIYKMTRAYSSKQENSVTNMICVGRKYAMTRASLVATAVFLLII